MKRSICPVCNNFYSDEENAKNMCPACIHHKDQAASYILTHRQASIAELIMATDVPMKIIKRLIELDYIQMG